MWTLQWIFAGVVLVVGALVGYRYLSAVDVGTTEETASPAERRKTYEDLGAESGRITSHETATLLLDIARDLYDRKHSAYDTLDDKAQKLVALLGGGASLFALFAGFTGGLHVVLTPLLVVSAICFFASLILLLQSLRPIETDIPAITMFNSVPVLADSANRGRVARRMIEAWQEITLGLTPILRRKGRFIFVATLLIVVGASLLLTNFLILVATAPRNTPTLTKCSGRLMANGTVNLACMETTR